MADLREPFGQDVKEKPVNEFEDIQSYPLHQIVIHGASVPEGNPLHLHSDDSLIGHCDPAGVAPEIFHDSFGVLKGPLAVDDPLLR